MRGRPFLVDATVEFAYVALYNEELTLVTNDYFDGFPFVRSVETVSWNKASRRIRTGRSVEKESVEQILSLVTERQLYSYVRIPTDSRLIFRTQPEHFKRLGLLEYRSHF